MRSDLKKRLAAIESGSTDWISRLEVIDYLPLENYADGSNWQEVHHDQTVTVYRHRDSGEVRGVYADRRSDRQKQDAGGNLEFL